MSVQLKYRFIRTPLERPLMAIRRLFELPKRLKHPELSEIYKEDARVKEILKRVLRSDSNCLDIGCHYGSMLSEILRHSPGGQHVAVEAIPEKANFLRQTFPEVRLASVALSNQVGTADFYINTARTGFSGLAEHGNAGEDFQKIKVPCQTLDDLMKDSPKVDFVKIDVEGAEEMVLSSGRRFLAQDGPVILFECGPSAAQAFGRTPSDLYNLFRDELNYDVFFLKDWLAKAEPVTLDAFEKALVYPFQAFNWIAQPRRA